MASNFLGISQDYMSSFFGNSGTSSIGSSSGSTSFLSDYASIKSGAYRKLMKSYYAQYGSNSVDSSKADTTKQLTVIKDDAKALSKDAENLYKTGSNSLFNKQKVTTKDEKTGVETTSYEYNMDAIYKAAKSFVDSYNNVLKSAGDSGDSSVLRNTVNMTSTTQANSKLLSDMGISIKSDNTLVIDEKKFKAADMNTIKSMFNGNTSYAASIDRNAFNIQSSANSKLTLGQLYGSNGQYNYSSMGSLYDSIF